MAIDLTQSFERSPELAHEVRGVQAVLEDVLPTSASAVWDLDRDDRGHDLLVLALSDPWGHTVGRFAPDELRGHGPLRRRLHDLVGELINPSRRIRIDIRDALVAMDQLEDLRRRISQIHGITDANFKMFNRARSTTGDRVLVTDFSIEISPEPQIVAQVREAVRAAGFNLRGDPLLNRHGMQDRVRELVQRHLQASESVPRYAICVNTHDADDLHLIEIADDAPDATDRELDGVGFAAGDSLPGARSIVIYLVSPRDLRRALRLYPTHPIIQEIRSGRCWFAYPDDGGDRFYAEFPEFRPART